MFRARARKRDRWPARRRSIPTRKQGKCTLSPSHAPFNLLRLSQLNAGNVKAGVSIEELALDFARLTLLYPFAVLHEADAKSGKHSVLDRRGGSER